MPDRIPARRNILKLLGVLLLAAGVMLGIRKYQDHSAREPSRAVVDSDGSFDSIHTLSQSAKLSDRKLAAELQRECDEWFAEVLARNPELKPGWRTVADEDNGFLQMLAFAERHRMGRGIGEEKLDLPEELHDIISGRKEWNHDQMAALLAGHHDLINEITRIGLLPDQSAAGVSIDRFSFVGARFYKQCADLLLADARLAAELGDAGRSLESVRATLGIARHWSDIETPSLLMETVSVLVRLGVDDQVCQHILPALDLGPDALADWQIELNNRRTGTGDFAQALRGDAYVSIRGMAIPALVKGSPELSKHDIPDPDAFLDATIDRMLDLANQAEGSTPGELATSLTPDSVEGPAHLSPGAQDAYATFYIGAGAWSKGWSRAVSIHARTDAALAIMAGTEPPVEPITGLPFVFDPEARTLAHPDDPRLEIIDSEPITLP